MKKTTFFAMLFYCALLNAQHDNIVDRPVDGLTALISTEGIDGSGVYSADSFTTNEAFALNSITFYGQNSNGESIGSLVTGLNVILYTNNGGSPGIDIHPQINGSGIIEFKDISSDHYIINQDDNVSSFTVDLISANGGESPMLAPGTYWIVFYPSVTTFADDSGRWNWFLSPSLAPYETLLIDPQDMFGFGATGWNKISNLIGDIANSFAWTMTGTTVLGVNDNKFDQISVYPNPAKDFFNVKIPSHMEVTHTTLFNMLGKKINTNLVNGQMNVSDLSKGLYILNLETASGTLTQKLLIE